MAYFILPKWLLKEYEERFIGQQYTVPLIEQRIMARFIADGHCPMWQDSCRKAREHKIKVCPVSPFWLNKDDYSDNALVLGYGMISEDDIPKAVEILSQVWFD